MTPLHDETYRRIIGLMYEIVGLSFTDAKKPLVSSRLSPRIQKLGLGGYEDYLALISRPDDGGELQMAIDLLTTNETYFFREPKHFEQLEREIAGLRPASYSVWSAACSFGDEPYSVAMLLGDLHRRGVLGADWSVLGTDISDRVLRAATAGIVPEERLRHVSPERLKRWCLRGEGAAAGKSMSVDELRARVRFGQLNLSRPIEGLGPFDAVFLRNVLIYFDPPTKAEVVDRVLTQLKPGGLFFIGTAEGRVPCRTPLQPLGAGVCRKGAA
jgi:chemotaxis protein methyltransferase CheR